jgi:hypothetical protein
MITFFVRFGIFLTALIIISFVGGLHFLPFVIACIFICSWITVVALDDILWWIIAFAIIFGLINYDIFGIYMVMLIGVAFLFEVVYKYIVSTANDNFMVLFITSFSFALICVVLINLIQFQHILISFKDVGIGILVSGVFFFVFRFIIGRAQRFINLYTHGSDMRCHT